MHRYITKFFLLSLPIMSFAQVPNGDFEQWAAGAPVGWWTNNFLIFTITQSPDAHSGSSAVKGEVLSTGTSMLQPLLISGLIGGHGFPISARHANLTGYYKLNSIGAENVSIVISPFKNGQLIGVGGSQFFAASTYTPFTVPILYSNGNVPDSCQISITIGNNTGPTNIGAYFIIDDLVFQGIATAIDDDDLKPENFSLEQNYPNPFNPSTRIIWHSPISGLQTLKIYDLLGKEVVTLVNQYEQSGTHEAIFDAAGLPSGMYFYRLNADNFTETKKMILLR